jgi:hypothetical protein
VGLSVIITDAAVFGLRHVIRDVGNTPLAAHILNSSTALDLFQCHHDLTPGELTLAHPRSFWTDSLDSAWTKFKGELTVESVNFVINKLTEVERSALPPI